MKLENVESKETIMYTFFKWLFDDTRILEKQVDLEKEFDLSLAPYYMDANIYYPICIAKLLDTIPFKRLGRISQLSLAIDTFPNAYHSRLEHSKGTYYRKLEEFIYNFQDKSWRKKIENNHLKLYVLADLIKMLGHDIGHTILSHAMEQEILSFRGAHEIIGQRIMTENNEICQILSSISPQLPRALKDLYEKRILNFQEHDESNYDVDRIDYLSRDNLYFGTPINIPFQKYETVQTEDGTIDVYPYSSMSHIETFLEIREKSYKDVYFSLKTHLRESTLSYFIKAFIDSESEHGKDLKQFLETLKNADLQSLDLAEFLQWDDIRFYKNILDIAQNHENENIRALATMTIPNIDSFLNLIYSHLNVKNVKKYSQEDEDFLRELKSVLKGNTIFSKNLRNKNYAGNNILISEDTEKNIRTECESFEIPIYAYKKKEPIYVKDENGFVYELSEHPNRKYKWDQRITIVSAKFVVIPFLKYIGVHDDTIHNDFKTFKTLTEYDISLPKRKIEINLQPLQVGHDIENDFLEL